MTAETNRQRIVEFEPAFDKTDPDPDKNYGVGAAKIRFVLKGPEGAVQFLVHTGWYLPHLWRGLLQAETKWAKEHPTYGPLSIGPEGWDLGYHSPRPMYDGQTPMGAVEVSFKDGAYEDLLGNGDMVKMPTSRETGTFDPCQYLDGAPCYYDGSGLNAKPVMELLLREGSDAVWARLEEYYDDTFQVGRLLVAASDAALSNGLTTPTK